MHKNADLSDYCDNITKPEGKEAVLVELSTWLASEGVDVFWKNRSKRYRTFTPTGSPSPDLLINTNSRSYVICVAEADQDSRLVRTTAIDAVEIWERMAENPPTYDVELAEKTPTAVLIATEYSPEGHLFAAKGNLEPPRTDFSEGRREMADRGFLPSFEYGSTETVIRMAWDIAKRTAKPEKPGIGALLSSQLDEGPEAEIPNPDPAAFYYTPGRSNVHHWEAIPWYLWK